MTKIMIHQNLQCPRCGCDKIMKYGKHPKTKQQKYCCKNCRCQFSPSYVPKQRFLIPKYGFCPKYGSRMEQRKRNKNTIQLRCSNRPYCRYTISYNFKLKTFFDIALRLKAFFQIPKFFKYPHKTVFKAVKFSLIFNLPFRKIKFLLGGKPLHITIIKWTQKLAYLFTLYHNNSFLLSSPPKCWHIDDTIVKINEQKYRLFGVFDPDTRFILAWFISPTKDKNFCLVALRLALKFCSSKPSIIVSDHAEYIASAVYKLFADSVQHIKVGLFDKMEYPDNRLERFFSNVKSRFKNRKNIKIFKINFVSW